MMVKIFCFLFFFNRKTRDQSSIMILCFSFRQIHKKIRFPGLLRFLLQISHNMTTIRVKKKLIKMGGWDGEVEIKELKKKIFHQLISCSDLTRKHSSCETQWGQNFLWNYIWIFPPLFHEIFFPRFFHYYEWKSFDREKNLMKSRGCKNWNATSKWLWSHCA